MSEASVMKIAIGDQVRVHFHPPYPMQSFCEGTVSRVDGSASDGRFFVIDVTHEVILDWEHPIRRGFRDFVLYECPNDFPGRIEVLSGTERATAVEPETLPMALGAQETIAQDADETVPAESDVRAGPLSEQTPEAETKSEETPVDVELQPANEQRGLLATLFGRKK
ncbi:hypothetical protein IC232_22835 [Microvirga sp. BT688]|uniref:hypothetical protein n=1 Tax=Microvirga sp. TaxID=1873136 RepID=UPI001685EBB5|nr:hypothetical protein [Microvirga sp.]MBD2749519.1 hypothetical protein [Microvirga sp.]